ncbi:MAG: RimK family alpha-L-glutamate ligase [Phycisphaerae bacterium]
MRIALLSRSPQAYSTRRLIDTARQRGHRVTILDTLKFAIDVEETQPGLLYRGKRVSNYDAIIPRIGASVTFFGTAVLRQFEQMGVFTLNSSHAITVSRDKLRTLQILSRHTIGLPASAFVREKRDVLPAIERLGGAPVVIKLLEGTQGIGVILADKKEIAAAIVETLQSARENVLIQKFVAESKGKDVRAFVVGGRVVAAMRRRAEGQEFRSNIHRGGKAEPVELSKEFAETAVRASQILGLRVAGVDMLESNDGPKIMEVNSSPGLEGIERATGLDIAEAVIQQLEQEVSFPDIDLRQRLTLRHGYGVAEFTVNADSPLAQKELQQTHLKDQEVMVMTIDRNGLAIPSPSGDTTIFPGDKLLCFGKLLTLRGLIPPKKRKKRRKKSRDG